MEKQTAVHAFIHAFFFSTGRWPFHCGEEPATSCASRVSPSLGARVDVVWKDVELFAVRSRRARTRSRAGYCCDDDDCATRSSGAATRDERRTPPSAPGAFEMIKVLARCPPPAERPRAVRGRGASLAVGGARSRGACRGGAGAKRGSFGSGSGSGFGGGGGAVDRVL